MEGITRRREQLESALARMVSQLAELGAVKVVLFGSLAEGKTHEYSDLDLLVVMPSTRTGKEWTDLVYTQVERGVASDLVVYSLREYQEMVPQSAFLRGIEANGRVVYDACR